jgi:hypothetical protein
MWDVAPFQQICQQLNIEHQLVANAYIFGSVKLGLQSEESDVDLIFVTHHPNPLVGHQERTKGRARSTPAPNIGEILFYGTSQNYFHDFDLRTCLIDGRKYDVVVYDQFQFRNILQCHFMVNVECIFSQDGFILKQDLDFLTFYLESCLDKVGIFHAIDEEINYCLGVTRNSANGPSHRRTWAGKKIFNTARYFSTFFQLLRDGRIVTFTALNPLRGEIHTLLEEQGSIDDALELAVERVRHLLVDMNASHDFDDDLPRIYGLIEKWADL